MQIELIVNSSTSAGFVSSFTSLSLALSLLALLARKKLFTRITATSRPTQKNKTFSKVWVITDQLLASANHLWQSPHLSRSCSRTSANGYLLRLQFSDAVADLFVQADQRYSLYSCNNY